MAKYKNIVPWVVILFATLQVFANEKSTLHYHHTIHLLESGQSDYIGPWFPQTIRDQLGPKVDYDDGHFFEEYGIQKISDTVGLLNDFWFKEYNREKDCPNAIMAQNGEYIRYLYRLISISYLFETLVDYSMMMLHLGGSQDKCLLEWDMMFKSCRPEYEEMIKFVERTKGRINDLIDTNRSIPLNRKGQQDFNSSMKELLTGKRQPENAGEARLKATFSGEVINLDDSRIKQNLNALCREDMMLMQKICAEEDRFFGLSKIPQARLLVEHSNAITVLRQKGHSNQCLGRFTDLYKNFEEDYHTLETIFPHAMQSILKRKNRYRQGGLFLLGALKEFDDKGLADILKPVEESKVAVAPAAQPTVVTQEKKEVLVAQNEVKKPELEIPPVQEKKTEKRISYFELAVDERVKTHAREVAVNMQEMRMDYLFSEQVAMTLSGTLGQFQTRKALTEMKKFDYLGSKAEPVRLLFLKFLIDHDFHQGLFNMTSVLGEQFWVVNDIDKKKDPQFIRLQNDESTNNRWQIYVLAPPSESEQTESIELLKKSL